jgi:hypothetical protein
MCHRSFLIPLVSANAWRVVICELDASSSESPLNLSESGSMRRLPLRFRDVDRMPAFSQERAKSSTLTVPCKNRLWPHHHRCHIVLEDAGRPINMNSSLEDGRKRSQK